MRRDVAREIAFTVHREHLFDRIPRVVTDPVFDDLQILGHEPGLGEQPVFHMIGGIHLHQRTDEVPVTPRRRGARDRLAVAVGEHRGAQTIGEALRIAADRHDVGVARHQPEGIELGVFGHRKRRIRPRPCKLFVQRVPIAVCDGVDDGGGYLSGQYRFRHATKLPRIASSVDRL